MLHPVTLKGHGAPVVHVHWERHRNRPFGIRRPFAIAFVDVQMIGDDAKLLASHLKDFVVVNRVRRCISGTLGVHRKPAICAEHEKSSTEKLWSAKSTALTTNLHE